MKPDFFQQIKAFVLALAFVFMGGAVLAQPPEPLEKLKQAKVAMLTSKMNLSEDQAKGFFPIYNEYEIRRRLFKSKMMTLRVESELSMQSDDKAKAYVQQYLDMLEQYPALEREYKDKFLKVISYKQLVAMYQTENDFTKGLLKRLGEQRGPNGRGPNRRDQEGDFNR